MHAWARATANLALGVVMVGCGNVAVDGADGSPGTVVDAAGSPDSGRADGPDAAASSDAGSIACSPDAPITQRERVEELNGRRSQCCAVLADPLTVYFAAGEGPLSRAADIYRATRPSPDAPFESPELILGGDTEDAFWAPSLSADGLSLYYSRAPATDLTLAKVHRSVRATIGDTFGEGEELQLGSEAQIREADSAISDGGLFFARGNRIFFARPMDGGFAPGELVVEIVSGANDRDVLPAVSFDRKVLYWGSNRVDPDAVGDYDIWLAELESDDQYSTPRVVPGVNSEQFDAPSWISPDGCELYFTRRPTGNLDEIWVGRREAQ